MRAAVPIVALWVAFILLVQAGILGLVKYSGEKIVSLDYRPTRVTINYVRHKVRIYLHPFLLLIILLIPISIPIPMAATNKLIERNGIGLNKFHGILVSIFSSFKAYADSARDRSTREGGK